MPDPVEMQVNTECVHRIQELQEGHQAKAAQILSLLDLLKAKDNENIGLSKIVRIKDLEREKADLQVKPSDTPLCLKFSFVAA